MIGDDESCTADAIGSLAPRCACPKCRFATALNAEIDAAHSAMDRKERELDEHGYGGDPSKPPAQVVGLDYKSLQREDGPGFPRFERPAREDYVRVSVAGGAYTVEPAVEYRADDSFDRVAYNLRSIANRTIHSAISHAEAQLFSTFEPLRPSVNDLIARLPDSMAVAQRIGERIAKQWPDRAYFVEVWQDGREGFAQVFQPFGVPRNR